MMDLELSPRRRARVLPVLGAVVGVLALVVLSFQLGASIGDGDTALSGTDELEPVVELYGQLREEAVSAPESDELVESALQGMLDTLEDPYAHFYDERSYAQLNQSLEGQFSGVGLVLEDTEDGPVIVNVFEGSPAGEAGISAGERIIGVDGEDVTELSIEQLVTAVKGEAGTDVRLTLDGGPRGEYTVSITRAEIDIPQIDSRLLDDGAGYIQVLQFSDSVGDDVRTTAEELLGQGAGGIVLDLRGNPGGYLNEAVEVASVFIDEGPIVSVQERQGERQTFEAEGDALDVPLVVLIDRGSASASEIVAGAVKDRGRGELVGEQTFGKGTVQTIHSLPDGLGAKFTTARYYTPSGKSIEDTGITPDQVVEGSADQLAAAQAELNEQLARAG